MKNSNQESAIRNQDLIINCVQTIVMVILIFMSLEISAQPGNQRREKIESMKIGFLTEKLELKPEEAKLFWPVYNSYSSDLEKLRKTHRESFTDMRNNFDQMSDSDISKAVDNEIIYRQNELDVQKKYHPEFKKVLPARKVAKLYQAEEAFTRKLLENLRERRSNKPGPGPGR